MGHRESSPKREKMPLACSALLPAFCHFPHFPQADCALSGADSRVSGFVYILGPRRSLQWTLLWGWEFLLLPQPPQIFTVRGFEALFPCAGTLGCTVCLASKLVLQVYLHVNVGPHGLPATTSPTWSSSHHLAVGPLHPSCLSLLLLDECFFFLLGCQTSI